MTARENGYNGVYSIAASHERLFKRKTLLFASNILIRLFVFLGIICHTEKVLFSLT